MQAEPNPATTPGLFDGLVYVGGAIGALLLGIAGYMRKPRPTVTHTATLAGGIVDNSVVEPLLRRFDDLTSELRELISIIKQDVMIRERAMAEEQREEEMEKVAERVTDSVMERVRRELEKPAAPMPKIRDG